MRLIGYARVSTAMQFQDGVSLDAQASRIADYCRLYDHELVGVTSDVGSGKSLARDGLAEVLGRLEAGEADGVIIAKLDRLTRSIIDLGSLLEEWFSPGRFDLVVIAEQCDTSTAAGRLVMNLLVAVSQWEREVISERTSAALQHKKRQGERVGRVPYGWCVGDDGITLLEDEGEQRTIHRVMELRADDRSWRWIAERLDTEGVTNRGGRPWNKESVRRACGKRR